MDSLKEFHDACRQRKSDEWFTQEQDVEIIVPFLKLKGFKKILCPFDKESSNFVKILINNGFDVHYSHIENGEDFFNINELNNYDAVVSNPPYSKRNDVLKRLYEQNIPFAIITNITGLFDNRKRFKMFSDYGLELLIPSGRMKFFNNKHNACAPMFQSIYVCWNVLPKQIVFVDKTILREEQNDEID